MIAFPNCKINLGLNIIRRRIDNYHDIETVFYPLNFTDVLEIIPSQLNKIEFTVTGLPLSNSEDNLCVKAYNLLKKDFPALPFIKMHLHKAIPTGAGLGGGSSDAAFTLKLLNDKFTLNLTSAQLQDYASQLGSDCPFFIVNKPCFASGRGEYLLPININLSPFKIILVNPSIHIDTSHAFSGIMPKLPIKSVKEIILQPITTWKQELINDFEIPVFENYPEIKKIKETLYEQGALYASLTGSGSTVYGLFNNTAFINTDFPVSYSIRIIDLK